MWEVRESCEDGFTLGLGVWGNRHFSLSHCFHTPISVTISVPKSAIPLAHAYFRQSWNYRQVHILGVKELFLTSPLLPPPHPAAEQ